MWRFIGIGMDCLSSMLLLAPVMLLLVKIQGRKIRSLHTCALLLYICAMAGIYSVTGMPTLYYFRFELSLNLIPIVDLFSSPLQYLLNILMFLPVGFFLPILWERYGSLKKVLGFGCFLTLFIEIAQVFTFRTTDIDDLLTNLLGTCLGYLLIRQLGRLCHVTLPLTKEEEEERGGQCFYLLALMLQQFLLQPYWSAFFWDTLL